MENVTTRKTIVQPQFYLKPCFSLLLCTHNLYVHNTSQKHEYEYITFRIVEIKCKNIHENQFMRLAYSIHLLCVSCNL